LDFFFFKTVVQVLVKLVMTIDTTKNFGKK